MLRSDLLFKFNKLIFATFSVNVPSYSVFLCALQQTRVAYFLFQNVYLILSIATEIHLLPMTIRSKNCAKSHVSHSLSKSILYENIADNNNEMVYYQKQPDNNYSLFLTMVFIFYMTHNQCCQTCSSDVLCARRSSITVTLCVT